MSRTSRSARVAIRWTAAAVCSSRDDGHPGSRGLPHLDRDSGLGAAMASVRARSRRAVRMAARFQAVCRSRRLTRCVACASGMRARGGQIVGHWARTARGDARVVREPARHPGAARRTHARALLGQHGERFPSAARSRSSAARRADSCDGSALSAGAGGAHRRVRPARSALSGRHQQPPDERHGRPRARCARWSRRPAVSPSLSGRRPAVALVSVDDSHALTVEALRLLSDDRARRDLGARGRDVYRQHFDLRHTIGALRRAASQEPCASPS